MNSGDVFILDCEEGVYQWNGSGSNVAEKSKAAEFCQHLRGERGNVAFETLDEADAKCDDKAHPFCKNLPGEWKLGGITMGEINIKDGAKGGDDEAVKAFTPALYRLRDGSAIAKVGTNKPPINKLLPGGVFLLDTGFQLFLWVGKEAPRNEKTSAFLYTQGYLKKYKRPPVLPITRYGEGQESAAFKDLFGPPAKEGGCCVVS